MYSILGKQEDIFVLVLSSTVLLLCIEFGQFEMLRALFGVLLFFVWSISLWNIVYLHDEVKELSPNIDVTMPRYNVGAYMHKSPNYKLARSGTPRTHATAYLLYNYPKVGNFIRDFQSNI